MTDKYSNISKPLKGETADHPFVGNGMNNEGTPQTVNEAEQGKKNKFQQVVRRHIGKDRLFHLVTSLMKSIEDEKRAHRDLILSFETARNIKIDIPTPLKSANELKPKRRRKKLDLPLLDRIKAERKASADSIDKELKQLPSDELFDPENVDKAFRGSYRGNSETATNSIIGKLEIDVEKQKQCELIVAKDTDDKEIHDLKDTDSFSNGGAEEDVNEESSALSNTKSDESPSVDIHGIKSSSIQRYASSSEKSTVIDHFRATDDNFDLDKLVLDSVLQNTCLGVPDDKEAVAKDYDKVPTPDTVVESNYTKEVDSLKGKQVIVEVESDFSDEESHVVIDGLADGLDTNLIIQDSPNHYQSQKFNNLKPIQEKFRAREIDEYFSFSTDKANKIPSMLQKPSLSTITEADRSAASFGSLYDKSSEGIIEIETNKASLNEPFQKCVSLKAADKRLQSGDDTFVICNKNAIQPNVKLERTMEDGNSVNHTFKAPKVLCIDLLGVYESNEDLQRINLKRSTLNRINDNRSSKNGSNLAYLTDVSFRRWKSKHKQKAFPFKSNSVKFQKHNSNSHSSDDSCLPSLKEEFRNKMVGKAFKRYTKPDAILWTTLNVCQKEEQHNHVDVCGMNESKKLPCLSKTRIGETRDTGEKDVNLTPREQQLRNVIKESVYPDIYYKEANTAVIKRHQNVSIRGLYLHMSLCMTFLTI